jgi:hypothetical protein
LIHPSGGGEPPVLADYCVQWGRYDDFILFFPCNSEPLTSINGVLDDYCGLPFGWADFQDYLETGNVMRFITTGGGGFNSYYFQVITPASNSLVPDFGYIEFDIFGSPSGQLPIAAIQNTNCVLKCWTATFNVDDVNTQGLTAFYYNGQDGNDGIHIDWTPIAFANPGHDAFVMSLMAGYLEPSATFVSSFVGNTVTVTWTTIMDIGTICYGAPGGPDTCAVETTQC